MFIVVCYVTKNNLVKYQCVSVDTLKKSAAVLTSIAEDDWWQDMGEVLLTRTSVTFVSDDGFVSGCFTEDLSFSGAFGSSTAVIHPMTFGFDSKSYAKQSI